MDIFILLLATWRLSSLIANERGPFDVFGRIRELAGIRFDDVGQPYTTNEVAEGIQCIWCNSVWIGVALTLLYWLWSPVIWLLLPLALSAGVIVLNEGLLWLERIRQPY